MQKTLREHRSAEDLSVSVVWIDVCVDKSSKNWIGAKKAAQRASLIFDDPRVHHFFDPSRRVGKAIAEGLLRGGVAWDIFLFYDKGTEWLEKPPKPARWMHQLPPIQADPEHLRAGDALVGELRLVMKNYGFAIEQNRIPRNDEHRTEVDQLFKRLQTAALDDPSNAENQVGKVITCPRCAKDSSARLCAMGDQRRVRFSLKSFAEAMALEEAREKGIVLARTMILRIDEMTCPGCPTNVAKILVLLPGVEFVDVSYDEKRAIVTLGKGKVLNHQTIIEALEKAGYGGAVTSIRDPE